MHAELEDSRASLRTEAPIFFTTEEHRLMDEFAKVVVQALLQDPNVNPRNTEALHNVVDYCWTVSSILVERRPAGYTREMSAMAMAAVPGVFRNPLISQRSRRAVQSAADRCWHIAQAMTEKRPEDADGSQLDALAAQTLCGLLCDPSVRADADDALGAVAEFCWLLAQRMTGRRPGKDLAIAGSLLVGKASSRLH